MHRAITVLLGVASLAVFTIDASSAADGCGRGRYWNGYRCAGGYVRAPGYGAYGYYQPRSTWAPPYRGPGPGWHRPFVTVGPSGTNLACAHPRYTVQDGICKPYRGY